MDIKKAEQRIKELSDTLKYHNRKYYIEDSPEISDFEYDALLRELENLEAEYPQFLKEDSPTQNVGGAALRLFTPVKHGVKMESLQDVFSYDEFRTFAEKIDLSKTVFSLVQTEKTLFLISCCVIVLAPSDILPEAALRQTARAIPLKSMPGWS